MMLKQINQAMPLSKYYQIGESIKESISNGSYKTGQKLPTCRALSKYFDTTVVTISKAMNLLESQGYIYKIQGNGMFIKEPKAGKKSNVTFKKAGLLMPIKKDLYQNIADVLIHTLEESDYEAIPLGYRTNDYKSSIESKEIYIKKYVERNFASLIINGDRHFSYKLLHKYKNHFKQLNFIAHYESALDFPEANIITVDYEKVGYLAGKYLIGKNKKQIVFITYEKLLPEYRKRLGSREFPSDSEVATGIKRAMLEAAVEPDIHIIRHKLQVSSQQQAEVKIKDCIKQGCCGIMTMGDRRALGAYHAVNDLELKFGEHCSIVGLFNTPWTEIFKPSMTSISINEREIGRLTAQAVIEGWKGKKIKVEPELIIRET